MLNKSSIENHFDRSIELELELERKGQKDLLAEVRAISDMAHIHYIRQQEPKGLGHAVYCARGFIGTEPFAVLLGDDIVYSEKPCLKQMTKLYSRYQASILGVRAVAMEDVSKYGIVDGEQVEEGIFRVKGLVEKPTPERAPSNIAILGRYILSPAIFEILEHTRPGKGGEIQLTDALKELTRREAIYAYTFEGRRYDLGDKQGFLEATVEYALRREELRGEFLGYLTDMVEKGL